jgi:hypothetical protein
VGALKPSALQASEFLMSKFAFRIAVVVLLTTMLVLLGVIGSLRSRDPEVLAKRVKQQVQQAMECAVDIKCLDMKYSADANYACERPVERLAKNNFEWFNTWPYPKFSHLRLGPVLGSMTVIGEKIKFQNGFGAWIIHKYECDFDTNTKTVLASAHTHGIEQMKTTLTDRAVPTRPCPRERDEDA